MRFNYYILLILLILFSIDLSLALDSAYGPKIEKDSYIISRSKIDRVIYKGDVFRDYIDIYYKEDDKIEVSFSTSDSISELVEFETAGIILEKNNLSRASFLVKGKEIGSYSGVISLRGGIKEDIPVNLSVTEVSTNPPILINIELPNKYFLLKRPLDFKLNVNKLKPGIIYNASFSFYLYDSNNKSYFLGSQENNIISSYHSIKKFNLPEELTEGYYTLEVTLEYDKNIIVTKTRLLLKKSFLNILIFGFLPMWLFIIILSLVFFGFIGYFILKKYIESKKKYQMKLDLKTIPKKEAGFFYLGKIAEKNIPSYLDPLRLMTHSIVAGATGGGKSIAAQVIIEEALINNVAVIVMDPTAQWSGMLRKCQDKKMFSYYPRFGMKESDARGFKGNVRQITNSREIIDINKYVTPGQIQIFSLNKLDPNDIDFFVANFIRQIFKSDPKESPTLKFLLVFDEVHRLLSKFGGTGEGFLQVERACREFRKWGLGVMLISQVLSDFVGEIKANISTEVQMRTRDEGDLKRIQIKYGDDFLRSLVKASVGVGMFVNPAYNHARPYFINFRPILHNTRRLPDEELEKYNKYNDLVDDLEFQIEQLEKEKIDVFDLKMELKLVKDKIMTGNFSVVEIYLEGLVPRIAKEWEKLGKQPKKREIELVNEEEIRKSIDEAKKAREKYEKEEAKKLAQQQASEKQVVQKENLDTKEVVPLTFDNGVMISSLGELKGVLPNMDSEIFKIHVNDTKNEIADWIYKNISKELGEKLKPLRLKSAFLKEILDFGKEKSPEKKEENTKTSEENQEEKPKETEK